MNVPLIGAPKKPEMAAVPQPGETQLAWNDEPDGVTLAMRSGDCVVKGGVATLTIKMAPEQLIGLMDQLLMIPSVVAAIQARQVMGNGAR
jgi:hypothetical protein